MNLRPLNFTSHAAIPYNANKSINAFVALDSEAHSAISTIVQMPKATATTALLRVL